MKDIFTGKIVLYDNVIHNFVQPVETARTFVRCVRDLYKTKAT